MKEFATFSRKATPSGNMTYEALRSSQHDDIVLSVLMGLYVADKIYPLMDDSGSGNNETHVVSMSDGGMIDGLFISRVDYDDILNPSGSHVLEDFTTSRKRMRGEVW
jgi:hypothetical protein